MANPNEVAIEPEIFWSLQDENKESGSQAEHSWRENSTQVIAEASMEKGRASLLHQSDSAVKKQNVGDT